MIFVDTSFWVALRNRKDGNHQAARGLITLYGNDPLVTTNHVRGECWTYLRRKSGHRSAVDFLDAVDRSPRISVVTLSGDLEESSLRWLRRHDEREFSFVDATSFAYMRLHKIVRALAFDDDFSAAGFTELRLPG